MHEHRRTRHLVHLPTPGEKAHAALEEEIKSLKEQLRDTRSRIESLKKVKASLEASQENQVRKLRATLSSLSGKGTGKPEGDKGDDLPFYPAAKMHGCILSNVPDRVLHEWETNPPERGIGISLSVWMGVGVVVPGTVRFGTLEGFQSNQKPTSSPSEKQTPAAPRVLQFKLEVFGYRSRRPGQLKLFRNRIVVRHIFPEGVTTRDLFTVKEGDLLRVQGNYAQHKTYDAVSKSFVENSVVEADTIGLLRRGEPSGDAKVVSPTSAAAAAPSVDQMSRDGVQATPDPCESTTTVTPLPPPSSGQGQTPPPERQKVKRHKKKRRGKGR